MMEYSQEMEKFPVWRGYLRDLSGIPVQALGLSAIFAGLASALTQAARIVQPFANHTIHFQHGFMVRSIFCSLLLA